jgi:hypothetical protein
MSETPQAYAAAYAKKLRERAAWLEEAAQGYKDRHPRLYERFTARYAVDILRGIADEIEFTPIVISHSCAEKDHIWLDTPT